VWVDHGYCSLFIASPGILTQIVVTEILSLHSCYSVNSCLNLSWWGNKAPCYCCTSASCSVYCRFVYSSIFWSAIFLDIFEPIKMASDVSLSYLALWYHSRFGSTWGYHSLWIITFYFGFCSLTDHAGLCEWTTVTVDIRYITGHTRTDCSDFEQIDTVLGMLYLGDSLANWHFVSSMLLLFYLQ